MAAQQMIKREVVHATLGKGFADNLDTVILNASDEFYFTKRDMIDVLGCGNFMAGTRLNKTLRKLKITKVSQLFKTDPLSLYRIKRVGDATVFVAMCILHMGGYDVMEWWGWKTAEEKKAALARVRKHKQDV